MRCACCKKRTERGSLSQEKRRRTRKASTRGVFVMRDSPSGAFFEIWFDCFGGRRRCGSKVWPDRACRTIWPKTPPQKSPVLLATAHLYTYNAQVCVFDGTYYRITTTNYISKTSLYVTFRMYSSGSWPLKILMFALLVTRYIATHSWPW